MASVLAASLLSIAGVAHSGTLTVGSATGTPGSNVTIPVTFAGDGTAVDFRVDYAFDGLDFVSVTPLNGGSCVRRPPPNDNQVRVLAPANATNDPIGPATVTYCEATFTIPPLTPEPSTIDLPITLAECFDNVGDDYPCVEVNDGFVNVVGLQGPIITFTPDGAGAPPGTPINLGASGSSTITAAVTAGNEGDSGGPDGQVNSCALSGPDASEFAVSTAGGFPIQFTAGETGSAAINVTCDRGPADLSATLTCQVDDRNGARDEVYALTCPGAVPADLALNPNGGAFALPGGLAGSTSSRNIAVEVVTPGETGGGNATVSCSATAGFTITGSPVTVPPGSTTGGTIGVSCTIDTVEQTGTVTCTVNDANGTNDVVFDAVCPAGSTLPPPQAVPTLSNWGLLALILVTLGLGAGFAYRRLS
jgi:hypothetical protein